MLFCFTFRWLLHVSSVLSRSVGSSYLVVVETIFFLYVMFVSVLSSVSLILSFSSPALLLFLLIAAPFFPLSLAPFPSFLLLPPLPSFLIKDATLNISTRAPAKWWQNRSLATVTPLFSCTRDNFLQLNRFMISCMKLTTP